VTLSWNNFSLDFSSKTYIMGILNVTPDSFSDAGLHFDTAAAVERALRMVDEGADIIDIGGESTRPGADPLPPEEELRRVLPVFEALSNRISIPLSVDTYKAEIAGRAIEAGASMINDISGARFDPAMPKVAAESNVPIVLMHIKGTPRNMQSNPVYAALIPEVIEYLEGSIKKVLDAGVRENMIIIDPGIGFGKTFGHNLTILKNLSEFAALGKPLLVGPSRKAFLGRLLGGAPPHERIEGTAAAVAISIMNGANILRVHDVKEMARVARVADAIRREQVT
jgi:dihydropteroate synthase